MEQQQQQHEKQERVWYSVRVSSVQLLFTLIVLVVVIAGGFAGYLQWKTFALEGKAAQAIQDAGDQIAQIERRQDKDDVYRDHKAAWELLDEARTAFDQERFAFALDRGEQCLMILRDINDSGGGSIRALSVDGNVEYRRGEPGAWRRLRQNDRLNPGDWVKTSTDGTAELLFKDRSTFTLRPSTMVHLGGIQGTGGKDRATDVAFGQVELSTTDRGRTVTTPQTDVAVRNSSDALVSFDRDRGSGRIAAFKGNLEVTHSNTGQKRSVGALQQVDLRNNRLSEVKSLPGQPRLEGPSNDHMIEFPTQKEVTLAWNPIPGASRYALRIASTRLFSSTLIEDERPRTSARVGIRGQGNFFWQVAAVGRGGARGPWSESRAFRVTSTANVGEVNDKTPPALEILGIEPYGALVLVNGRSETGATVTINGENVALKPDGSFSKTVQMTQAGWSTVEVVAKDVWGNAIAKKERVFIDAI